MYFSCVWIWIWIWTPCVCVFEWQFHLLTFKTTAHFDGCTKEGNPSKKLYELWSPFHKQGMDQSNKCSFELQLHWTSSLINLTIRVPHLDFNVCFGVAGWPWYQIHYFFSASVPSNSPSAWYITTDRCDLVQMLFYVFIHYEYTCC